MRFVALLALVPLATLAQQWEPVAHRSDGFYFVDPHSILARGAIRQAWTMTVWENPKLHTPTRQPMSSMVVLTEVNCADLSLRLTRVLFYRAADGAGPALEDVDGSQNPFRRVLPSSLDEVFLTRLCK